MEFRNAMTILFSHVGYVFKIMLWIIISLIITAAVGVAILIPLWKVFVATTGVLPLVEGLRDTAVSVWSGRVNFRVAIFSLVPQIIDLLRAMTANPGAFTGLIFTLILLYVIYSFVMGLSYYTIGDIIDKLMASNLRFGFASNMALNFKRCCKYSFARLLVSLPIDLGCFTIGLFLAYGLFTVINIFTLPIMLIISVLFCSLRSLLFSGWLPRTLHHPEERVFTSFSRAFTFVKSNLGGLFKAYFVTFSCVYLLASVLTVPTGGLILLVLPSIYYFLLRAVELVGYYKTKGKSFYVDGSTVVNTVDYGVPAVRIECKDCLNGNCANCAKNSALTPRAGEGTEPDCDGFANKDVKEFDGFPDKDVKEFDGFHSKEVSECNADEDVKERDGFINKDIEAQWESDADGAADDPDIENE